MHLQELHSLCLDDPLRNLPRWPYIAVAVTPRLMMSAIFKTDSHASHGSGSDTGAPRVAAPWSFVPRPDAHAHLHTPVLTHMCTDTLLREAWHCAFTQLCFKPVFMSIRTAFLFDFCVKLTVKCKEDWYNCPAMPMRIELEGNFTSTLACTDILLRCDVSLPQHSASFLH